MLFYFDDIIHEYFRNHCGHNNKKPLQLYLSALSSIILYTWKCACNEGTLGSREETSEKCFVVQANLKVTLQPWYKPC